MSGEEKLLKHASVILFLILPIAGILLHQMGPGRIGNLHNVIIK
jgi:hypothetical protein